MLTEAKVGPAATPRLPGSLQWTCDHAEGSTALVVGDTRADTAIALGVAGHVVTATFKNDVQIRRATQAIEALPDDVRGRLTPMVGSDLRLGVPSESFDTLVLVNLLPHSTDLGLVLDEALRVIRLKGLLLVRLTLDEPDREGPAERQLTVLLDQLEARFQLERLDVIDAELAIAARGRPTIRETLPTEDFEDDDVPAARLHGGSRPPLAHFLLDQTRRVGELEQLVRDLRTGVSTRDELTAELEAQRNGLEARCDELQRQLDTDPDSLNRGLVDEDRRLLQAEVADLGLRIQQASHTAAQLEAERDETARSAAVAEARVSQEERRAFEAGLERDDARARLSELTGALARADERAALLGRDHDVASERVAFLEAHRAAAAAESGRLVEAEEHLSAQRDVLSARVSRLESDQETMRGEQAQMARHEAALRAELAEAADRTRDLTSTAERLQRDLEANQELLESSQQESDRRAAELAAAHAEVAARGEDIDALNANIASLTIDRAEAEDRTRDLTSTAERLQRDLEANQELLATSQQESERRAAEFESARQDLINEVAKLERARQRGRAGRQQLADELTAARANVAARAEDIDALNANIASLIIERDSLTLQRDAGDRDLGKLHGEWTTLKARSEQLEEELDRTRASSDHLAEIERQLLGERVDLQQDLARAIAESETLGAQYSALRQTEAELHAAIDEQLASRQQLELEQHIMAERHARLEQEHHRVEERLAVRARQVQGYQDSPLFAVARLAWRVRSRLMRRAIPAELIARTPDEPLPGSAETGGVSSDSGQDQ